MKDRVDGVDGVGVALLPFDSFDSFDFLLFLFLSPSLSAAEIKNIVSLVGSRDPCPCFCRAWVCL